MMLCAALALRELVRQTGGLIFDIQGSLPSPGLVASGPEYLLQSQPSNLM
jgi:hypothetical protein